MADGAVLDVPAGIHHLEPFQMLDALRRFGEGALLMASSMLVLDEPTSSIFL